MRATVIVDQCVQRAAARKELCERQSAALDARLAKKRLTWQQRKSRHDSKMSAMWSPTKEMLSVVAAVCEAHGVSQDAILGGSTMSMVVRARTAAAYMLYGSGLFPGMTLETTAMVVRGSASKHTTVGDAINRMTEADVAWCSNFAVAWRRGGAPC